MPPLNRSRSSSPTECLSPSTSQNDTCVPNEIPVSIGRTQSTTSLSRLKQRAQRNKTQKTKFRSYRQARNKQKTRSDKYNRVIAIISFIFACALFTMVYMTRFLLSNISSDDSSHTPKLSVAHVVSASSQSKKIVTAHKERKEADITRLAKLPSIKDITWRDLDLTTETTSAPLCSSTPVLDPSEVSFTLVTQVSEDRMWMIQHHCSRWGGPISVAIFTDKTIEEIDGELIAQDETGDGDASGSVKKCYPNQVHVKTLSKSSVPPEEYPVNTLRNLAMTGVSTSHLFYADVDFWVSRSLHRVLHSNAVREAMAEDHKLALVVPAFQIRRICPKGSSEAECDHVNTKRVPNTQAELMEMVHRRAASAFDPTNRGGHGSTNYMTWTKQKESDIAEIPCIKSNRYEPYLAARYCREFPPYQDVFTGYGKNKMTQVMQMRHTGYQFSQIGGVFLVHYPHLQAKTRKEWDAARALRKRVLARQERTHEQVDWTKYKRGQVDKIFVEFKRWLKKEVKDESRVDICENAENDDEKLWI